MYITLIVDFPKSGILSNLIILPGESRDFLFPLSKSWDRYKSDLIPSTHIFLYIITHKDFSYGLVTGRLNNILKIRRQGDKTAFKEFF